MLEKFSFGALFVVLSFINFTTILELKMKIIQHTAIIIKSIALILVVSLLIAFKFPSKKVQTPPVAAIKTVVIDAGHGGKDPGCHGASHNEKTVCLAIALELGKKIKEKYPDVKVVYTRDTDVFVELDERARIANKANADLFICIHANSASPSAYGAETYVLGLHRTEAQAKIAERENSTIYLEEDGGLKYKDFDMTPDAIIARQLQLAIFLDQSILFAENVQAELKSIGRYNRGVKQAGFLVLYKTTMPSVLIETGFLTHAEEERFLGSKDGQSKMANAFFNAFAKYKASLEGVSVKTGNTTTADTTTTTNTTSPELAGQVIFRVQIETSETKIPSNSSRFKNHHVFEYLQDKLFKYTVGEFVNNYKAANDFKNEVRKNDFPNAFVVAFQNGERISLEKAIKLAEK